MAVYNTFVFDWLLRQKVAATVNAFMVRQVIIPDLEHLACMLPHCAIRLSSAHADYEALWREQLGDTWREDRPAFTWPVLEGNDARWAVRAVIDAVVADAYGLDRDQYDHILSTFSHASYPQAPELCLEAYDELKTIGLKAFTKKHDPYWDIPLNENLPDPVIDLPIPEQNAAGGIPGDLFRQKDGQTTFVEPGPLYEGVKAREPGVKPTRKTRRRKKSAPKDKPEVTELDYQELLAALRSRGELTSTDAQKLLDLPASAVRPLLKRLLDEGLAVKEGKARATRYVVP